MKNNSKAPKFLLIKNFPRKINEKNFEFLKKFGKAKISFLRNKNSCYIDYENQNIIDEVIENQKEMILEKFGPKTIIHKVEKVPLDLNPPSKIILLIIYNKSSKIIDKDFVTDLLNDIAEPEKLILFEKNNSTQALIKFYDIDAALEAKKKLPNSIENKIFFKFYFTDKQDIIVNKNNKNEFDFSVKSSVFSKNDFGDLDSLNSLKNIKTNDLGNKKANSLRSKSNNKKANSFNEIKGDDEYSCLYVISETKLNLKELFNLFSIYGSIKTIKISENNLRGIIFYLNNNDYKTAYDSIKIIPSKSLNFKIILPTLFLNNIHNKYLIGKDINLFYDKIKRKEKRRNKTIKISKFQKLDSVKLKNTENFDEDEHNSEDEDKLDSINVYNYTIVEQRNHILKKKDKLKYEPSRFLIISNLNPKINLIRLEKFFKTKLGNESEVISFFQLIKGTSKYLLICSSVDIAVRIIIWFHDSNYEDKTLNIYFADCKIKNIYKKIYKIKEDDWEKNKIQEKVNNVYLSNLNYSINEGEDKKRKKLGKMGSEHCFNKNELNNSYSIK